MSKKIKCPICLEDIETDNLQISKCGHKYCSTCYGNINKCAICRKGIKH